VRNGAHLRTLSPGRFVSARLRGTNTLQHVFRDHFEHFVAEYDVRYAKDLGTFRLERISRVATRFLSCGDYRQGVARIRCSNSDCRHEYFRPFSCRGFHLCPSCSQKRSLLFAEYFDEHLLLALPHRQFVFTFPRFSASSSDTTRGFTGKSAVSSTGWCGTSQRRPPAAASAPLRSWYFKAQDNSLDETRTGTACSWREALTERADSSKSRLSIWPR